MKLFILNLILFLSLDTSADAKKVVIECNGKGFKVERVQESDGDSLYTSYNLYFKSILQASNLQGDLMNIAENGDANKLYQIFTSNDEKTHIQIDQDKGTGAAYLKLKGQFYPKIILLDRCKNL